MSQRSPEKETLPLLSVDAHGDTPPGVSPARLEGAGVLLCTAGDFIGLAVPVSQEIVMGRHPSCHIRLNEAAASRRHAAIYTDAQGRVWVEDLDSRNGTMVNGAFIQRVPLRPGDRIQVGERNVFRYTHREPVQQQLLRSQRMEAVGHLAGGIAHDFNNLLTVFASASYALETELRAPDPVDREFALDLVRDLIEAYDRASEITGGLLDFARQGEDAWGQVNLSLMLAGMSRLARRSLGAGIDLELQVARDLWVRGHRGRLEQALMNLVVNARDAIQGPGRITVRADSIQLDPLDAARIDLRLAPGDYVRIVVEDTGSGIEPEAIERIFEPFFTTKGEGRGTGLGLSMVHGIFQRHGGHIGAHSQLGVGTRMVVHLPQVFVGDMEETGNFPSLLPDAELQVTLTAWVVDDEGLVRRATARMLQPNCRVTELGSGPELLSRLEIDTPDLVVMDVIMPGMSGLETLNRLRMLHPSLPVLLCSGSNEVSANAAMKAGATAFLRKPYTQRQIQDAVYTVRQAIRTQQP